MHYHYFTLEQRNALAEAIRLRAGEPGMTSAAARLHDPAYGVCESCAQDIPFIRMMSDPRLRRCVGCLEGPD
jgi:RNA polymerase-binding transcription factor DksA